MARSKKVQAATQPEHAQQLPRLRRIEGQVRGLQQMISSGRDCVEIAHQINAAIAALRRVQSDMLREHLTACAESALNGRIKAAEARRIADEMGRVWARLG
jgi:CsoR family transcriptional regulator, copper-sensing transcriptional repressor